MTRPLPGSPIRNPIRARLVAVTLALVLALLASACSGGGKSSTSSSVASKPALAESTAFMIVHGGVRYQVTLEFDKLQLPTDGDCEAATALTGSKWVRLPWTLRNTTDRAAPVPPLAFSLQKPDEKVGQLQVDLDVHVAPSSEPCSGYVLRTDSGATGTIPAGATMHGTITTAAAKSVVDPSQWTLVLAQDSEVEGDTAIFRSRINRGWVIAAGSPPRP
jgi:hypothetical protein